MWLTGYQLCIEFHTQLWLSEERKKKQGEKKKNCMLETTITRKRSCKLLQKSELSIWNQALFNFQGKETKNCDFISSTHCYLPLLLNGITNSLYCLLIFSISIFIHLNWWLEYVCVCVNCEPLFFAVLPIWVYISFESVVQSISIGQSLLGRIARLDWSWPFIPLRLTVEMHLCLFSNHFSWQFD
jgi:hypothetical protein